MMRDIKSAVITGPTKSIGQALCRLLLSKGITVFAVCRSDSPGVRFLPKDKNLHIIYCDVSHLECLAEKMHGESVDAFFHFAWAGNDGNNRNNMELQTNNILYALKACHAANDLHCKVFIGAGSQAEYGRVDKPLTPDTPSFPENGYGMAKLCAGQMTRSECHKLGIEHIWPRFLSVYGPYEQLTSMTISTIIKLLKKESPVMTPGEQIWDYLYSEDAAEALYKMALSGHDGAVYTLGGGQARPLREYVEKIRDSIDPDLSIDFGGIPYSANQLMHLEADNSVLTADTGFVPSTGFEDGIQKTIEWVRGLNI